MNKKERKAKDLTQRTIINGLSALLIGVLIFLAEYSAFKWVFTTAVASVSVVAIWEYNQLLKKKGLSPASILSMIAVIFYIFAIFLKTQGFFSHAPEMVLGLTFFACFVHFAVIEKSSVLNIPATFFGLVYIGIPLGFFVRVMYFFTFGGLADPQMLGSWWVIYLLAVTKSADIGGYFIGSYFGKRKLAHHLSPNKTLEGALGGLVGSIFTSLLMCFLGKIFGGVFKEFSYFQAFGLGIVMGIFGQLGDLAESLLKRDCEVKDSNSIPGVGGILDMIDSLLFTAPILYIFLRIVYT